MYTGTVVQTDGRGESHPRNCHTRKVPDQVPDPVLRELFTDNNRSSTLSNRVLRPPGIPTTRLGDTFSKLKSRSDILLKYSMN